MIWQHPLLLFVALPAALAAWRLARPRPSSASGESSRLLHAWVSARGFVTPTSQSPRHSVLHRARGVLIALGVAAALLALARPQWGTVSEPRITRARDVVVALDLSRSMLADDVAPSRLARAKLLVNALLDQLRGDRVGLIIFSGTSFVQSPLSADYEVLREILSPLGPNDLPVEGTDYTAMLQSALSAFDKSGDGDHFLVVLSDGESHDEHWRDLVPALKRHGITVIALGVGTPQGAILHDDEGGLIKDAAGGAVLSRLEPKTLQALAAETGGVYRDASVWVDIADLVGATVARGRTGELVEDGVVRHLDRFQWFLAPAVIFFLLGLWLEVPAYPSARAVVARPKPRGSVPCAAVAAGFLVFLSAVPSPSQADESTPNPIADVVASLVSKPQIEAADYAAMAETTANVLGGSAAAPGLANGIPMPNRPTAAASAAERGGARLALIDDALAAVDRGESLDAKITDWPSLRARLEALKQPPPEQPQRQSEGDKDDKESEGQGNKSDGSARSGDAAQSQSGNGESQDASAGGEPQAPQGDADRSQDQEKGSSRSQADHSSSKPNDAGSRNDGQGERPQEGDGSPEARPGQNQAAQSGAPNSNEDDAKADSQAAAAGSDVDHRPEAQPSGDRDLNSNGDAQRDNDSQQERSEVAARKGDLEPLDGKGTGLGAFEPPAGDATQPEEQHADGAAPQKVGGGQALAGLASDLPPELADAAGRSERVVEGDAPAVLFERMRRAEGAPAAQNNGKPW